jgi:hypothetical protein
MQGVRVLVGPKNWLDSLARPDKFLGGIRKWEDGMDGLRSHLDRIENARQKYRPFETG